MTRIFLTAVLAIASLLSFAGPAAGQASDPLRQRGEQVMAMLRGEGDVEEMFTAAFLAQVPAAQLRTVSQQLVAQYGAPRSLRIEPEGPNRGKLHIETERGLISMDLVLEASPPNLIGGLRVTEARPSGDTLAAVAGEIAALPGQSGFAVIRLGDGGPAMLASHSPDRPLAIGSTFKLFILAELSRQVQAGQRQWSDVVALEARSLPSGILQNFPVGSPVTLHTLASLMISISDNTATDALLRLIGRENVERMMTTMGVSAPERNRPFLGTAEIFALKTAPEADRRAFIAANEAERRRLLATLYAEVDTTRIDPSLFAGQPLEIEALEWFASPADLARVMDWFRVNGDETSRQILAISPGGPASMKQDYAYAGFKGGSEPGVINLTWLIRNRAGAWHVVTGSWNNPAAPVDEARFTGLMGRALALVR
jgi:beta-lactamase class A